MIKPNQPFLSNHRVSCVALTLALLTFATSSPAADIPTSPTPIVNSLHIEPTQILLRGANRQQQLLITGETDSGPIDITHRAKLSLASNTVARLDAAVVQGLSDGVTELTIECDGQLARLPIRVEGFATYPPVHFGNDVIPIFSKLGCNSGGCHGRAAGQNGFKLSVFGFDAAADYEALVDQGRGRRVFPASPASSLILLKPTATLAHGGGQRLKTGSDDYQVLLHWIDQGMPHGDPAAATLASIVVSPAERVLRFGQTQQILATAIFSDGSRRDVTSAAAYASNAPTIVEVDAGGLVHAGSTPGEAAITVNYRGQVAAVPIALPRSGVEVPTVAYHNRVDELVWAKFRKMGIAPSELCDDATFFRRAHLDTIGCLPTPDEARRFLADTRADKRSAVVDALLARPEYADLWALKWADILLVDRDKLGDRGAFELHRWLREQFASNRPYDAWVRELLTATGSTAQSGPANFFRAVDTPDALARVVGQAFLGVRIECAQCHHHPFERWSQEDFYGFAGFFNGVERKPLAVNRSMIYQAGPREMRIPRTNQLVATRPLGGESLAAGATGDPRIVLARWLTEPNNPWFARLVVNRIWKHYLGRGLVESEDDLRSTNPATNEPLLAFLASELVEQRYDLKHVMRLILNSRVYQLSSATTASNFDDEQNFSHFALKRLPAETLMDAIATATEVPEAFAGRVPGTRAMELWDNRLPSYFLEIFGRPERNSPCECGRSSEPTMAQALHLMNAPQIEAKISEPTGRVARLINSGESDERIVEELTLAALGRAPREKELKIARELFASNSKRRAAEDYLWTLLNSYDFLFIR